MDHIDRTLLARLQQDAAQSYAALGQSVGLSAGAAHEHAPESFAELPEILEAHVIAGSASVLVKVRTATAGQLQDVLCRIYAIDGVSGTQVTVVLETFFERPVSP
jgi:DNA-binding Lrp family transcriptional regulator